MSRLVVVSGPSGVGKSSIMRYLREHHPEIWFSVSATTRPPRPDEVDGVHYFFVDPTEFDRMVAAGEFLEWATFSHHRYGTPAAPVRARLDDGQAVIVEIELQGARQVRLADPTALLVFVAPPSWDDLVQRLLGRGTESAEVIAHRLDIAKGELAAEGEFDVTVVNDDVARAAQEIARLATG